MIELKTLDSDIALENGDLAEGSQWLTRCKNCVFATEPGECYFGRPEKFIARGNKAVRYEGFDGGHTLINAACKLKTARKPWMEYADLDAIAKQAREEASLKVSFIIFMGEDNNLEDLSITYQSLIKQSNLGAIKVISFADLSAIAIFNVIDGPHPNRMVERVMAGHIDILNEQHGRELSYSEVCGYYVDKFVRSAKIHPDSFYGVIHAGNTLYEGCLEWLDSHINDEVNNLALYEIEDGSASIYYGGAHYLLGGHYREDTEGELTGVLSDRIKYIAAQQGEHHLVQYT